MKRVVLLVFLLVLPSGKALECYTCSIGEQDTDTTCADDVTQLGAGGKVNCNKKYCTTIRQEYKDPQGKVASMYRGCEDQPIHMNEIIEDGTYRFYYTACTETLCNGGSGKASDGGGTTGSLGDKSTIMTKGIGAASSVALSTTLIITVFAVFCFL